MYCTVPYFISLHFTIPSDIVAEGVAEYIQLSTVDGACDVIAVFLVDRTVSLLYLYHISIPISLSFSVWTFAA